MKDSCVENPSSESHPTARLTRKLAQAGAPLTHFVTGQEHNRRCVYKRFYAHMRILVDTFGFPLDLLNVSASKQACMHAGIGISPTRFRQLMEQSGKKSQKQTPFPSTTFNLCPPFPLNHFPRAAWLLLKCRPEHLALTCFTMASQIYFYVYGR